MKKITALVSMVLLFGASLFSAGCGGSSAGAGTFVTDPFNGRLNIVCLNATKITVNNGDPEAFTNGYFRENAGTSPAKVCIKLEGPGKIAKYAVETIPAASKTVLAETTVTYTLEDDTATASFTKAITTDTPIAVSNTTDGSLGGTAQIDFSANSLVKADGTTPATNVTFNILHEQPTTASTFGTFPGVFAGRPLTGDAFGAVSSTEIPFETYGYVNVSMTDADGEVKIKSGEVATLTVKTVAGAPSTIPLWSFNETNFAWEQVGTATLDTANSVYVGQVQHFSWYNFDQPLSGALKLTVTVASYTVMTEHELNYKLTDLGIVQGLAWTFTENIQQGNSLEEAISDARTAAEEAGADEAKLNSMEALLREYASYLNVDESKYTIQGARVSVEFQDDTDSLIRRVESKVTGTDGKAEFDIKKNVVSNVTVNYGDKTVSAYAYQSEGGNASTTVNLGASSFDD